MPRSTTGQQSSGRPYDGAASRRAGIAASQRYPQAWAGPWLSVGIGIAITNNAGNYGVIVPGKHQQAPTFTYNVPHGCPRIRLVRYIIFFYPGEERRSVVLGS